MTEMTEMHEFTFEAAEEILRHGVIVRFALAGHTLAEMQFKQTIAVVSGGILDASVAMEDQPLWCKLFSPSTGLLFMQGHQCAQ